MTEKEKMQRQMLYDILRTGGISASAKFGVKMPDTWTPIFDLSSKSKVQRINEAAERQIDRMIGAIRNRACCRSQADRRLTARRSAPRVS